MKKYLEPLRVTIAAVILGLTLPVVQADEHRHHEAHEHGVAQLNIAIEGNDLHMEFTSPAANIVGFEYHPRTQDQKDAVQKALKRLEKGDTLFILPPASESRLAESKVETDIEGHTGHNSESEHADEHDNHHEKEEKHEADDHGHERHSEFTTQYHFICKQPHKLAPIKVQLFQFFPGIEHIEVQLLTETKQTAIELTAKENKILF